MSLSEEPGWESYGLEVLRTADFDRDRLRRPGTYAVCFAATWCPPTRGFVPKFVAQPRLPGIVYALGDITDTEDRLWDELRIEITPTMIVFRNGEEVARFPGRPGLGLDRADLEALASGLGRASP